MDRKVIKACIIIIELIAIISGLLYIMSLPAIERNQCGGGIMINDTLNQTSSPIEMNTTKAIQRRCDFI